MLLLIDFKFVRTSCITEISIWVKGVRSILQGPIFVFFRTICAAGLNASHKTYVLGASGRI